MFKRYVPDLCPRCRQPVIDISPFCKTCNLDLSREVAKRPTKGICTYCGAAGPTFLQAMTEEHVYGYWLKRAFPPRHTKRWQRWERGANGESPPYVPFVREVPATQTMYDLQVPHVCKGCNGGWMKRLQDLAKPIILRIAAGQWPDLNEEESRIIARWCLMVSFNIAKHTNLGTIPAEMLLALKHGEIPERVDVSAIRIKSPGGELAGYHHEHATALRYPPSEQKPDANLLTTFFCIEQIGFLVTIAERDSDALEHLRGAENGIGPLPRGICPLNSTAQASSNQWLSDQMLHAIGLHWLCRPLIPVPDFSNQFRHKRINYAIKPINRSK